MRGRLDHLSVSFPRALAVVLSLAYSLGGSFVHAQPPATTVPDPDDLAKYATVLCGPISLTLVARQLGMNISLKQVTEGLSLTPQGVALSDLARAAQNIGLEAIPYRLSSTSMLTHLTRECPAIARIRGNHFVVVWAAGKGDVWLAEYPKALQRIPHSAFLGMNWHPTILVVKRPETPLPFRTGNAFRYIGIGGAVLLVLSLFPRRWRGEKKGKGRQHHAFLKNAPAPSAQRDSGEDGSVKYPASLTRSHTLTNSEQNSHRQ